MSAPFFRSVTGGISQIIDDVTNICHEGYNEASDQLSKIQQSATIAARNTGHAMRRTAKVITPYADNFAQTTVAALLIPTPVGPLASTLARGFVSAARALANQNGTRSLQRHWDSAGIGRPISVPPGQMNAGLDLLVDSLMEYFGPSQRNILVSPGGTEHLNPNRLRHISPRNYSETFRRTHTIRISRVVTPMNLQDILSGPSRSNRGVNVSSNLPSNESPTNHSEE